MQPSTSSGCQPARHHGEGDQRRQHRAQDGADIGHEAQRAGEQPPQQGVGHAEREQAGADQHREAEIGQELQRQHPRDARGGVAHGLDVACTSLAPNSRTNWSLRWSRSSRMKTTRMTMMPRQQRMQQRRHECRDAGEARHAALDAHGGRRAGPASRLRSWASEAAIDMNRLSGAAALRQRTHVLDLLVQVGLIVGEAAGHVGELGHHQHRDDAARRPGRRVTPGRPPGASGSSA